MSSPSAPDAPDVWHMRRLAGDTGALLVANALFLATGIVRTKLAAVFLGTTGLGVIGQLTQLMSVLMTVSVLGMATGIRLVLSRPFLGDEERAQIGKNVLCYTASVSVGLSFAAMWVAEPMARIVLGDPAFVNEMRLTLLAVPLVLVAQVLVAIAHAHGEFRRLTFAAVMSAGTAMVVTAALMTGQSLMLGVLTLSVAALLQSCGVVIACPSARRAVRIRRAPTWPAVREVAAVGAFSFVLGSAATIGELVSRTRIVDVGGLELAAAYQPVSLLSGQAYGLLFGAIGTTLLVHINHVIGEAADDVGAATDAGARLSREISLVAQRILVVAVAAGLFIQAFVGFYIPTFFTGELMSSARAVTGQVVPEAIRGIVWTLGAALLPLAMRRVWLASGLTVVATQAAILWFLLPHLRIDAVPWAMAAAWLVGIGMTAVPLAIRGVRLTLPTWGLLAAVVALLSIGWAGGVPSTPWSIAPLPLAALATVALAAVGWVKMSRPLGIPS